MRYNYEVSHIKQINKNIKEKKIIDILSDKSDTLVNINTNKKENIIYLSNDSFSKGPVIIAPNFIMMNHNNTYIKIIINTENKIFRLSEDIVFEPFDLSNDRTDLWNIGDIDLQNIHKLYTNEKELEKSFNLGFFTAILLYASNCILDLNNYTISCTKKFVNIQRFFSTITLGSSPFISINGNKCVTQGPANFSCEYIAPHNVLILNGTLGMSSHHNIHGNDGKDIFIKNINCTDFEVGAISLNGFTNLYLDNINIYDSLSDVETLSTWSSVRQLRHHLNLIVNDNSTHSIVYKNENILHWINGLKEYHQKFYNSIFYNEPRSKQIDENIDTNVDELYTALFQNTTKLGEGICYGINIGGIGVSVGAKPNSNSNIVKKSENVVLKNINISDIRNKIVEIPIIYPNIHDTRGAVLQTQNKLGFDSQGKLACKNYLLICQLLIKKVIDNNSNIKNIIDKTRYNVTKELSDWGNIDAPYVFKYVPNGDSMQHVLKAGIIPLRLDNCKNLEAINIKIKDINTYGDLGTNLIFDHHSPILDDNLKLYMNRIGIANNATKIGYGGSSIDIISLYNSENCKLDLIHINDVVCKNSEIIVFDIGKDSVNIGIKNIYINNLSCLNNNKIEWANNLCPTRIPNIIPINSDIFTLTTDNFNIKYSN